MLVLVSVDCLHDRVTEIVQTGACAKHVFLKIVFDVHYNSWTNKKFGLLNACNEKV